MMMGQSADQAVSEKLQPSPLRQLQDKLKEAEELASKISVQAQEDSLKVMRRAQALAAGLEEEEKALEKQYEEVALNQTRQRAESEAKVIAEKGKIEVQKIRESSERNLDKAIKALFELITGSKAD
ncbi:MAG TPA: hypothetical protein ENO31_03510 [Thermoprotei archaeon]|nr:hypothetical protein [Thermoprotei archaeon]